MSLRPRTPRLIILTQYYPPEIGAPQTRLAAMARILERKGVQVEIVTCMPHHLKGRVYPGFRRMLFKRDTWDGIRITRTWVFAATGTGPMRLLNYLSFSMTCFFGLLACRRPTVLFVESPPLFLSIPAIAYARLVGATLIFNVADLWPDVIRQLNLVTNKRLLALAEVLERFTYRSSAFVCTVTDGMLNVLRTRKHVPPEKLLFLPNGVDVELFRPSPPDRDIRRELELDDEDALFIYAGTHGVAQGLETLIEAAALLRGERVVIALIGDGHTKSALIDLARERKIKNVRFVATQPLARMPRYFSNAVASIVPLVRNDFAKEARPSKIFPSLAAGVPVIFSGEGEAADLIARHDVGIVVPPESSAELAEAIRRLKDPQLANRLSVKARQLAEDEFDWNVLVASWLDQLERQGVGLRPAT